MSTNPHAQTGPSAEAMARRLEELRAMGDPPGFDPAYGEPAAPAAEPPPSRMGRALVVGGVVLASALIAIPVRSLLFEDPAPVASARGPDAERIAGPFEVADAPPPTAEAEVAPPTTTAAAAPPDTALAAEAAPVAIEAVASSGDLPIVAIVETPRREPVAMAEAPAAAEPPAAESPAAILAEVRVPEIDPPPALDVALTVAPPAETPAAAEPVIVAALEPVAIEPVVAVEIPPAEIVPAQAMAEAAAPVPPEVAPEASATAPATLAVALAEPAPEAPPAVVARVEAAPAVPEPSAPVPAPLPAPVAVPAPVAQAPALDMPETTGNTARGHPHRTRTAALGSPSLAPATPPAPPMPAVEASLPPDQADDVDDAWLLSRARGLIEQGDISGARLVLEHALHAGSSRAAFHLAETYDPRILASWRALGIRGDAKRARELYAKASERGIAGSRERLLGLK
ncbi:hypothetical protein [Salinarimonas soli]|uniref:Tetratricopeptide repeat protein n=1 Tax=Salinarimonas soli TaxID=1638099 RepID=A0A5B2V8E8_9HYPH|nr:hypothetical protein [Salinarimonas soli]KAA2235763.1 hypothetical protein F0L46_18235 [Salinarimonas soli]